MFLRVKIQKIPDWTALSGAIGFCQKNNWEKKKNNNIIQCHCSLIPSSNLPCNKHTHREREIRALSQWKWFTKANLNTDVSDRSTLDFLWDNLCICTSHLQTPQLDERPKIFALVTPQGICALNMMCWIWFAIPYPSSQCTLCPLNYTIFKIYFFVCIIHTEII